MHRRELLRRYLLLSPLLPAPMCGYSDRPFRDLLRTMGAGLVYTEMFSSEAMVRGDPRTWNVMDFKGEEPPVAVQIFGSRPDLMAETARIVVRHGAAIVDMNLGCPANKITRNCCGAALAETPDRAVAVAQAVRDAVPHVPFTAKIRWQKNNGALDLARRLEDLGVDAIALHARTWAQGYGGSAEWEWIARLKEKLHIPVIGNGDILTIEDARRMLRETNCDAAMAGRGLVGNPWLVRHAAQAQETGNFFPELPDETERIRILLEHARLMRLHRGPHGLIEFRKHCVRYISGLPGARVARVELMQVTELDQLRETLERHFGSLVPS
ncbi:tRNA dihydrouridine synthase DusB [bacterium]|nr:tRNA dihydrouridine synthase DusB [bacterium]